MAVQIKRKWEPIANLTHNYGLEYLLDNENGLEIFLSERCTGQNLKLIFDNPLLYRNIDDSNYLNGPCFSSDFKGPWEFFIIDNSEFKKWFSYQDSAKLYNSTEITHYAIYTMDDCIDILSSIDMPPRIQLV